MEMRRSCPVDENGLPLVPEGFSECYEVCLRGVKETNKHHLLWPRNAYKAPKERQAREVGTMVVKACVCKHRDYHATYLPPKKPDQHTLCDIAQGDITPNETPVYIESRNYANTA